MAADAVRRSPSLVLTNSDISPFTMSAGSDSSHLRLASLNIDSSIVADSAPNERPSAGSFLCASTRARPRASLSRPASLASAEALETSPTPCSIHRSWYSQKKRATLMRCRPSDSRTSLEPAAMARLVMAMMSLYGPLSMSSAHWRSLRSTDASREPCAAASLSTCALVARIALIALLCTDATLGFGASSSTPASTAGLALLHGLMCCALPYLSLRLSVPPKRLWRDCSTPREAVRRRSFSARSVAASELPRSAAALPGSARFERLLSPASNTALARCPLRA